MFRRNPKPDSAIATSEAKMSSAERTNYANAIRQNLQKQLIKTAIMLGRSNLEGMERGVAEIKLQMVLEQMITPGFLAPSDRYEALRWFNWSVELINGVRSAMGCNILLIQAGFNSPLVKSASNGWN